jgi:hypothetical protein
MGEAMPTRIFITARRMSQPNSVNHEHIVSVKWRYDTDTIGEQKISDVPEIVRFIEDGGNADVQGPPIAHVGVRTSSVTGRKFIQTHADGYWNNNLLSLPEFR